MYIIYNINLFYHPTTSLVFLFVFVLISSAFMSGNFLFQATLFNLVVVAFNINVSIFSVRCELLNTYLKKKFCTVNWRCRVYTTS
jgi:hypothetical protein